MAFALSSSSVSLNGTVLSADCRTIDGSTKSSSIDLNEYFGNIEGEFNMDYRDFGATASSISLTGSVFSAYLAKSDGNSRLARVDLNVCIANIDGNLVFNKPHESIIQSASALSLEGSVLKTLCLGKDGLMHFSQIDLNDYYANDNGSFVSGDNHFYGTARDVTLEMSSNGALLRGKLQNWDKNWKDAEVDLAICVVNLNGIVTFVKHDGLFDRDGIFARFFERIPVVGFIVGGIQWLAGNDDQAMRAVAYCANSTTVMLGIAIGAFFGGPVGAAIGAGIMTPLGILLETTASGAIKDPRIRGQFEEATIGRYIYETLRNMLAAGAAAYIGGLIGGASGPAIEKVFEGVTGAIAKFAIPATGDIVSYVLLKKLSDALIKGELPQEWLETEKQVQDFKKEE